MVDLGRDRLLLVVDREHNQLTGLRSFEELMRRAFVLGLETTTFFGGSLHVCRWLMCCRIISRPVLEGFSMYRSDQNFQLSFERILAVVIQPVQPYALRKFWGW